MIHRLVSCVTVNSFSQWPRSASADRNMTPVFRGWQSNPAWIFHKFVRSSWTKSALAGRRPGAGFRHDLKCFATGGLPFTYLNLLTTTLHFLKMWHQGSGAKLFLQQFGPTKARMRFVDHHLAHAISAYGYSGFDEAAVVVMDGRGAWEATSIWHGRNGRLEHRTHDSVSQLYWIFLQPIYGVPWISAQ